jgi:ribose transport system ATP-binding protein
MTNNIIMECKGIVKRFGPVTALNSVDLSVHRGEIRGLIGENGSGKSTITSIFSGMQNADEGEMFYKGGTWHPESMQWALGKGVGMIVQECGTVPGITVAENMFLCNLKQFMNAVGIVNKKLLFEVAQTALNNIGASHIKATAITAKLDLMDRKLVEVAKIWVENPELIVVDETTTSLSQLGRDIIYDIMERMKNSNRSVVFISHDLDEIMEKCDTLTVLRDGNIIRTFDKSEFNADDIRTSMIGREMQGDYYRSDRDGSYEDEVVMEIKGGNLGKQLVDFNLQLHKGEILGVGGLSHCGMHTLGKVLFGAVKMKSGEVTLRGQAVKNPNYAIKQKVGYIAKDRDIESLCISASIKDNIAIVGLDKISGGTPFIFPWKERKYVQEQVNFLSTKCFSIDQQVSQLSGGNKQKVVFGKWIGMGAEILILDCPTRGIDIGVKQAMYQLMYKMKKEGKTIVMISEEMSELMGMSDRIIIMKDGRITGEMSRDIEYGESEIIKYMI